MKKKIFMVFMCIVLGMTTGIIRTKVYAKPTSSKVEANETVIPNDAHVKISKLTFKHCKNNKTEIMGSITNNSMFDANVKFRVTFSEIDESKIGTYKYTIDSKNIKAGETIKFNVSSYNMDLRHKRYKIKMINLDSEI